MAHAGHQLSDYISSTKYIEIKKNIQWIFHFTLMIVNDTMNPISLFLMFIVLG